MIGEHCLSCGKKWSKANVDKLGVLNYYCENGHHWTSAQAENLQEYETEINNLKAKIAGLEAQVKSQQESLEFWMSQK